MGVFLVKSSKKKLRSCIHATLLQLVGRVVISTCSAAWITFQINFMLSPSFSGAKAEFVLPCWRDMVGEGDKKENPNPRFFVAVHVGAGFHAPSNEKSLRRAMKRACLAAASVLLKVLPFQGLNFLQFSSQLIVLGGARSCGVAENKFHGRNTFSDFHRKPFPPSSFPFPLKLVFC